MSEDTPQPQREEAAPPPAPEAAPPPPRPAEDKPAADTARVGLPMGQVLLGGASAATLGGFYLASAVGPWAVAGVGATAVAAGGAYVHHRMAKRRGARGGAMERSARTQVSRSGGALGRMGLGGARRGGPGSPGPSGTGGRARRGSGAPARVAGAPAAALRPRAGSRPGGGAAGLGRGATGAAPRAQRGRPSTAPRGGAPSPAEKRSRFRVGRGSKRGDQGVDTTPRRRRFGGSSKPTGGAGRLRAAARRLSAWADGRTGRRASTAWRAASGFRGLRARARAARRALASRAGHHRVWTPVFAAVGAVAAALWSWQGRVRAAQQERSRRAMDAVDPEPAETETEAPAAPAAEAAQVPVDETNTDPGDPAGAPAPADTPTASTAGPTGRSTTMAGLPHARAATDMLSAAGRYEPADAYTVVREAREWPDVSRDVALSIRAYAQRLEASRFPLDAACLEVIQQYYNAVSQTVRIAEEIEPMLRKAHAVDLARQDSPRGDESKWNV